MVKSIYGEYATVANSVMPTWMAPYAKDVKQTAYDPEAAKKTLADKGITSLQCITYTTARPYNQKGGSDLARMIQGYLADVGVDAEHHRSTTGPPTRPRCRRTRTTSASTAGRATTATRTTS